MAENKDIKGLKHWPDGNKDECAASFVALSPIWAAVYALAIANTVIVEKCVTRDTSAIAARQAVVWYRRRMSWMTPVCPCEGDSCSKRALDSLSRGGGVFAVIRTVSSCHAA